MSSEETEAKPNPNPNASGGLPVNRLYEGKFLASLRVGHTPQHPSSLQTHQNIPWYMSCSGQCQLIATVFTYTGHCSTTLIEHTVVVKCFNRTAIYIV